VAARAYHGSLADLATAQGRDLPTFDALVLGMGQDGHTASIFPGSALLERAADPVTWCVAEHVGHLDAWRLTLTPQVLRAAHSVIVLVTGEPKHDILKQVLTGGAPLQHLPVRLLEDAAGDVVWFVDAAALFGA
jgi:6-phosphogluconolactonase